MNRNITFAVAVKNRMKSVLRIILYVLPVVTLFASCNDDPPAPGGGLPEIRYRISRISTTITDQPPGDYLFDYDDQNRLQFIVNEGRVVVDGRVEIFQLTWDNSRLESIVITAINSRDTIPISTIELSYSGSLLQAVNTTKFNEDGSVSGEAERVYVAQTPAITRLDTGYMGDSQFSNRSQFSILTGVDDIRTYTDSEVVNRTNNLQLTYGLEVVNPIRSFRLPSAYLPEIVGFFGLLTGEMPEIMLETDFLPTEIRNNFSEDGSSNSVVQEWQYGFAAATRVSDMRTAGISVEFEWVKY
jgi:hypothetical protein